MKINLKILPLRDGEESQELWNVSIAFVSHYRLNLVTYASPLVDWNDLWPNNRMSWLGITCGSFLNPSPRDSRCEKRFGDHNIKGAGKLRIVGGVVIINLQIVTGL